MLKKLSFPLFLGIITVFIIGGLRNTDAKGYETNATLLPLATPITEVPQMTVTATLIAPVETKVNYASILAQMASNITGAKDISFIQLTDEEVRIITANDPSYGGMAAQVYNGAAVLQNIAGFGPPCEPGQTFAWSSGYRFGDNGGKHKGYDGKCSNKIVAAAGDGVIFKYYPDLKGTDHDSAAFWVSGKVYIIKHVVENTTCYTVYGHLNEAYLPATTPEGGPVYVKAGQALGVEGATGIATGEHLHYGIYCEQNGRLVALDPALNNALGTR